MNFLVSLVRKHQVSLIVIGYPLNMDGSEGTQAQKIRDAAREIEQAVNVPVRLWDERLTSMQAHRALREAGMIAVRQMSYVDRMAAVLLLQNFLDAQANQSRREHRDAAEPGP
jgi:putative holliday junction resolvase